MYSQDARSRAQSRCCEPEPDSIAMARESGLGVDSGEKHVLRLAHPQRPGAAEDAARPGIWAVAQPCLPARDSLTTTSSRIKSSGLPA